jgi:hypothetical protein
VVVFIVYADFVVENRMKSDVLEIRRALHFAQVISIAAAQA